MAHAADTYGRLYCASGCPDSHSMQMMSYPSFFMLTENKRGSYSFLPGIAPYSAGVLAEPGFEIVHVRFTRYVPLQAGFDAMKQRWRRPDARYRHSAAWN